ncbi:AAA family ATPase, partial [Bacteroides caecigallinarum]|uniref:ATP-binding protein n=1 Tax=Bacteroides caecigallinarum TaxID=1411144 RepID=UPI00195C9983
MKYPIGIQSFDQIIERGYVYVDKTSLIYRLVNEGKIYFLSRPRRFGKSLLVSTLKSYFLGRKDLFNGLAISSLETEWTEHPVFHIDFNSTNFAKEVTLEQKINFMLNSWSTQYGLPSQEGKIDLGDRFVEILSGVHKITGQPAVVLIDEYDKPLLDVLDVDKNLEEYNRNILKAFYSVFKAADEHLRFVLLTGVTKFSQVSVFSGFNQPKDISLDTRYEALCGITQDEIDSCFTDAISEMAEEYSCSFEEMRAQLKRQYDGYHFSRKMTDIYNPFSLLNALDSKSLEDYWFRSGTPTYLIRLLNHFNENVNELTGKYYSPSEFIDYKADVERPLPMIFQSGYLTIKGYDMDFNTFLLDFPNNEVKNGFLTLVASSYLTPEEETEGWIRSAVVAMRKGDVKTLQTMFTSFLASIPYTI